MAFQTDSNGNIYDDGQPSPEQITVSKLPVNYNDDSGGGNTPQWVNLDNSQFDQSAFDTAAQRLKRGASHRLKLPVNDDRYNLLPSENPTYMVQPDLQDTQSGNVPLPPGAVLNDANQPVWAATGEPVPVVPRPGLIPLVRTPEGVKLAMPKLLDLASNIIGGGAAAKVPVKAGEMVLGSGIARTTEEVAKKASTIAEPFYSQLERTVKDARLEKGNAEQWLGYLKNQPGIKSEEINTVLKDLPSGQISKSQMEDIVKQNKVELKENVLGGNLNEKQKHRLDELEAEKINRPLDDWERVELKNLRDNLKNTKYHSYQLPGGDNYKEMLLKLPLKTSPKAQEAFDLTKRMNDGEFNSLNGTERRALFMKRDNLLKDAREEEETPFQSSHWDEPNVLAHIRMNDRVISDEARQAALSQLNNIKKQQHNVMSEIVTTNEPLEKARQVKIQDDLKAKRISLVEAKKQMEEYVVHPEIKHLQDKMSELRAKEDAINKSIPAEKKLLHMEELQSDLHQQGRDKGYKGEKEKLQPAFDKIEEKLMATNDEKMLGQPRIADVLNEAVSKKIITPEEAKTYKRYTDIENNKNPVPDAPFKNNWEELTIKRIIRHAAENGYEGISWEHGNAQALRYPDVLRKQVKNIQWVTSKGNDIKHVVVHNKEGGITEFFTDKNGTVTNGPSQAKGKHLSEVIGKQMAGDILGKAEGNIDAKDFVMGAEGMKSAYDVRIPNKFNEIGKKYGSKVEQREIPSNKKFKIVEEEVNKFPGAHLSTGEKRKIYDVKFNESGGEDRLVASYHTKDEAQKKLDELSANSGKPIHYFPITPALKAKALQEGFPLFSSSPILTPVTHNPFDQQQNQNFKLVPVAGNPFAGSVGK